MSIDLSMKGPPRGDPPMAWRECGTPVWDPAPLSGTQRLGDACLVCNKRWPRPSVAVGIFPDGTSAQACAECAGTLSWPEPSSAELEVMLTNALGLASTTPPGLERVEVWQLLLWAVPADHGDTWSLGCRYCALVQAGLVTLARHIQQTETVLGQDALPVRIRTGPDATAWLRAWAADAPPLPVIRELLAAVLADLAGQPR